MTKNFLRVALVGLILALAVPLLSAGAATSYAAPGGPAARLQRLPALPDKATIQYKPRALQAVNHDSPRFVFLKMRGAPLAKRYAARKEAGLGLMNAEVQRSYVQHLELAQQQVVAEIRALNIPVISTYQKVLNGVQVRAQPSQFDALLALPGVESIHPVTLMKPALGDSVPHIGAQQIIDELGLDGTGIDIGVIDTGVDYIHADFGGPATEEAYAANNHAVITDTYDSEVLFPTDKVVGGWDFAGELYDPHCSEEDEEAGKCTTTPQPDPDPMDEYTSVGHGTHVAGIAAGIGTENVPHGVAPGARLWALKVFGAQGATGLTADAVEWAVDPNDDGDISDALDVINLSIGADFSSGDEAEIMAFENAIAAGVVVVSSAGNAGDVPLSVGSPASIPPVISVASSYAPGETRLALEITTPDSIAGVYEIRTANFGPSLEEAGPITEDVAYAEPAKACQAVTNGAQINGKIALIDRGDCTFVTKVRHAQNAGAIAVIIVDDGRGLDRMGDDGTGGDITIPSVMISQSDGELIKGELPGVSATLSADIEIPRPDLTDNISPFSSRGPGWRRSTGDVSPDNPPTIFKPEITVPGSNIISAQWNSGTAAMSLSGTSMSSPHVAGIAALIKQAHPDWTPAQVKSAIVSTAKPQIYVDGNPEFGGGGTVAAASRMGAGLVDALAAVNADLFVLDDQTAAVDFGFQTVSAPTASENVAQTTSLTRDVTVENQSDVDVTYDVSFDFQDADDADAGVTISLSDETVTVPAGESATIEVTAEIDPLALKDWPLSGPATGNGDALRDIEYNGWLTFTPTGDGSDQAASTLTLPVYLLARKSANIAAETTSVALDEFGIANGTALELTNTSAITGTAQVFTLAGQDPNEGANSDASDVQTVGIRNTPVEGLGNVLEFAFATHAPRMHPIWFWAEIYVDVNQDRTADYVVFNSDLGILTGGDASGVNVTVVFNLAEGSFAPNIFYTQTDLLTTNITLPALAEDMGLGEDDLTFDYWCAVFDGPPSVGELVDVVPDEAFSTPARFTFDAASPLYRVDQASVEVVDSQTINLYADPFGALARPSAEGLLVLYDNSVTNVALDPVEVDFEYEVQELALEADRAATGFVYSKDVRGSSLGGSRMWTGLGFDDTRWYGVTQFDLATEVPSNAHIIQAELDLTGQETFYLNEDADATWIVEVMGESIDSTWPDVKYYMVHLAGVDTTLDPALRDPQLGEGTVNTFAFNKDQIPLLEQRAASTGRVSFRTNMELDWLSRYAGRHLFAWDGGGGIRIPGQQPPVFRIAYATAK